MRPFVPVLLLVLPAIMGHCVAQEKNPFSELTNSFWNVLPANHSRIFYAVMFDAGSTGTRIHVYTFIEGDSKEEDLPVLDNEMFHSTKPGLSAYADSPEMGAHTVKMLLKIAKKSVPRVEWKRTPVILRATAGLRLLPAVKAQALLDQVQHVLDESPFLVPDNGVSIMNGTAEGILAWVSLNFLTGYLSALTKNTVGILDLGGGSTQITFLPKIKKTNEGAPDTDCSAKFDIHNTTYDLYTHSYLGYGLMAGRLAMMGALGAQGFQWQVFSSTCLPKTFRDSWSFGGVTYQVSGISEGPEGFKYCYMEALNVVKGMIHQPYELQDTRIFYAFSYYFDRAVDAGLIDELRGGMLQVKDIKKRAKKVCSRMNKENPPDPFLCMDLTYIACLLKDGFGFKEQTVLQLAKKVKNVEASWALGATFDHLYNLRIR